MPLYHQVQRVLRSKIECGEWAPEDRLRDRLEMPLGVIREQLEARLPDEETAALLGIDLTQAVLVLRLIVGDADGRCLQVSDAFYRSDRYRHETDTRLPPRNSRRSRRRKPS